MKLESLRQDSQGSKEHEEEMLHGTAQGKQTTQICRKYAGLVLPVVVENL